MWSSSTVAPRPVRPPGTGLHDWTGWLCVAVDGAGSSNWFVYLATRSARYNLDADAIHRSFSCVTVIP